MTVSLKKHPSSLQPLHSSTYTGEWINVVIGKTNTDRKFVKPQIHFENVSGTAICLGNGTSRLEYSVEQFNKTNQRKILKYYNVMYGCNAIHQEWMPDFLTVTNQLIAAKITKSNHNQVYAPQEIARRNPDMNLIPGNPRLDAGSAAVYLACFHGARRVFLYGYDGQHDTGINNNVYANSFEYDPVQSTVSDQKWINNLSSVISAYPDVEFYRVSSKQIDNYRTLLKHSNYTVIGFRKFVSLADL